MRQEIEELHVSPPVFYNTQTGRRLATLEPDISSTDHTHYCRSAEILEVLHRSSDIWEYDRPWPGAEMAGSLPRGRRPGIPDERVPFYTEDRATRTPVH